MSVRISIVLAVLTAAVLALPATAEAQRGARAAKPACGAAFLPLVEGNEWVYTPIESPVQAEERKEPQRAAKRAKSTPRQPGKITIKVLSVETVDKVTTVTLEERADARTQKTTITCTPSEMTVSPYSVFFAAQPAGALLMDLTDLQRKGVSFPMKRGKLDGTEWFEKIVAKVDRSAVDGTGAELSDGSLEVERAVVLEGKENIAVAEGTFQANRIKIELFGFASMGSGDDAIKIEIPANTISYMWFAPGIGIVQIYNSFGHMYQLSEQTLN